MRVLYVCLLVVPGKRVKKKLDIYKFIRKYLKYNLIDPVPSDLPKTLEIWPSVRTVRIGMAVNTRLQL